jgi:NADPH:quinone reductase
MNAIQVSQFGGPEVLQINDVEVPKPQQHEVLVRVRAAGVNPYDTYMRSGAYGARNPALPYTPGSDAAGTVESVGPDGADLQVGDRVYTTGTLSGAYAEFALCKIDQVHSLPEQVSYSQGAGIYVPYASAYRSLFQLAHVKPGETVLIHGASGGVGVAAIQWARAAGLKVIGTAGSDKGLRLITDQGVHQSFNHTSVNYQKGILEATLGRGVDVIIEMLANVNLGQDLKMLAHRGRVVVVGSRGDVEITPRDLMAREATIMAVLIWSAPANEASETYAAIDAGLRNGTGRGDNHTVPLHKQTAIASRSTPVSAPLGLTNQVPHRSVRSVALPAPVPHRRSRFQSILCARPFPRT